MTPLHILIGIHYYAPPGVYAKLNTEPVNSDAVLKCTQDLVDAGLLVHRIPTLTNTAQYAGTEGLNMWIAALTQVPLPHRTWAMPQTTGETPLSGDRFRSVWKSAFNDLNNPDTQE